MDDFGDYEPEDEERSGSTDPQVVLAREELTKLFDDHPKRVFYTKQVEVLLEDKYFHWVTNRAIHTLVDDGYLRTEAAQLSTGVDVKLLWHASLRYYRRPAARIVELVEQYSAPKFTHLLGYTGEMLTQEALARGHFNYLARSVRAWKDKRWTETNHDLDFLYERDDQLYGIEIKNALSYIEDDEFDIKIRLAQFLGATPVFVERMLPRTWINDLRKRGGFTLVLKWHLYPQSHIELAKAVKSELGLPADAPRRLLDGTVQRLVDWHERRLATL